MAFRVGQKVVAIKFDPDDGLDRVTGESVFVGSVYTIREIDTRTVPLYGMATLRFEEIVNRKVNTLSSGWWELGYDPRCFRPIVERKTDTGFAILTEILNGQRVPEMTP